MPKEESREQVDNRTAASINCHDSLLPGWEIFLERPMIKKLLCKVFEYFLPIRILPVKHSYYCGFRPGDTSNVCPACWCQYHLNKE